LHDTDDGGRQAMPIGEELQYVQKNRWDMQCCTYVREVSDRLWGSKQCSNHHNMAVAISPPTELHFSKVIRLLLVMW